MTSSSGVEPVRDARVAVITGAGSGIGAATAIELGRSGDHVVICDLPAVDVSGVSSAVESAGGSASAHPVDIRDFTALQALARTVIAEHGRVDVLFANAGMDEQSTISQGDPDVWRDVVETNLVGTAQTVRAFLPAMIAHGSGDILVTGSTSGRDTPVGNPLYGSSKWGLVGLARALRHELEARRSGVRVTLIDTGVVDTPLARSIPALEKRLAGGHCLLPEDVARLVLFVIQQPRHVLLSELRIEPVIRSVRPTFTRKAGDRLVDLFEH